MAKIEIDHILCPMDFSEQSLHAYNHAVAMARWYDARITALHVVVTRPAFEAIPSIYTATLPPIRLDELRRELARDLERYVRIPDASELRVDVVVQEAPAVHHEILAQAGILNSAAAGLAYAVSLAEEADAELTLLHVVDDVVMHDLAMSARMWRH